MEIKFHSVVDIITNSSTVIFTWASGNAEAMVLELIDEVLAAAGSDKKAADLYSVTIGLSDLDEAIEEAIENSEDEGLLALNTLADEAYEKHGWNSDEYKSAAKAVTAYAHENFDQTELMGQENWMGFPPSTVIVVTRKDGKETRIDEILNNLFDADGGRDG